jgi:hypothetical protein
MMTGVLKPTNGTIMIDGKEPYANRRAHMKQIGVVFGQRSQLWWSLPVRESFRVLKDMYEVPDDVYEKNLALFESLVNIKELYAKPVRQLSLGQRMLCEVTAAFLHDPKIVFLDEPTIGLDVSVKDYEPVTALNGGEDGLDFYRNISAKWKDALVPDGKMFFEVGIGQADSVLRIMRAEGFGDIQVIKDLAGIPRVVFGTLCTEV